jgi:hypothetical protein
MKTVYLDIDINAFHRYTYSFVYFFLVNGYRVYVKERCGEIKNPYAKLIFESNRVILTQTPSSDAYRYTQVIERIDEDV